MYVTRYRPLLGGSCGGLGRGPDRGGTGAAAAEKGLPPEVKMAIAIGAGIGIGIAAFGGAVGQGKRSCRSLGRDRQKPGGSGKDVRPHDHRSGHDRVAGHLCLCDRDHHGIKDLMRQHSTILSQWRQMCRGEGLKTIPPAIGQKAVLSAKTLINARRSCRTGEGQHRVFPARIPHEHNDLLVQNEPSKMT